MNTNDLSHKTSDQLVTAYIQLSLQEAEVIDRQEAHNIRALFDQLQAICAVLRARGQEARRALLPLLRHRNAQVRLNAAKELLAVVPHQARATLQDIAASGPDQQSGDARATLRHLDQGVFTPT